jgi:hypothetical protein
MLMTTNIKINDHESKILKIHGKNIEIDNKLIDLITKLNKNKLITRGSCENFSFGKNKKSYAYVLFDYFDYIDLIKNQNIENFIKLNCNIGVPYYALNEIRHIEFKMKEYETKYNDKEVWIMLYFNESIIDDFAMFLTTF